MGNAQKADGPRCDRTPVEPHTILIKHTALTTCTHTQTHTYVHTRPIECAVRLATSHMERSKRHCLVSAGEEQEYIEANG